MQYADTFEACIYDACMCDACQKWGRTDQPTDKAILGVGCIHIYNPDPVHACMMHVSMMSRMWETFGLKS